MNLRKLNTHLWLSISLLAISHTAHGAMVETKKETEVYSSPDKTSAVVSKVKAGESLKAKERKGMYWQVDTSDGKSGYVSILNVKQKADVNGGLSDTLRSVIKEGRPASSDTARARTSVMGVRGLDDTNDTDYASTIRPNYKAVFMMEDYVFPQEKVETLNKAVQSEIAKRAQ